MKGTRQVEGVGGTIDYMCNLMLRPTKLTAQQLVPVPQVRSRQILQRGREEVEQPLRWGLVGTGGTGCAGHGVAAGVGSRRTGGAGVARRGVGVSVPVVPAFFLHPKASALPDVAQEVLCRKTTQKGIDGSNRSDRAVQRVLCSLFKDLFGPVRSGLYTK